MTMGTTSFDIDVIEIDVLGIEIAGEDTANPEMLLTLRAD